MAGFTNRGKYLMLDVFFRGAIAFSNFYMALVTDTPDQDDNTLGDLTEIAAGNGYTSGGLSVARNSTDFDTLTEDDTNDRALVQIKDLVWTASGGAIPASGSGALYAVLIGDNATVANRQVVGYFSLTSARTVSDGQTLTLQDCEFRLNE